MGVQGLPYKRYIGCISRNTFQTLRLTFLRLYCWWWCWCWALRSSRALRTKFTVRSKRANEWLSEIATKEFNAIWTTSKEWRRAHESKRGKESHRAVHVTEESLRKAHCCCHCKSTTTVESKETSEQRWCGGCGRRLRLHRGTVVLWWDGVGPAVDCLISWWIDFFELCSGEGRRRIFSCTSTNG